MPTYAPAPRQYKERPTLQAGDQVLLFRKGVQPDEGVRVDVSQFGGGGTSPDPANPSASLGLSAVNGSASTYMRSDAAPALSQGIIPTWTGLHTFNGGMSVLGSSAVPVTYIKTGVDLKAIAKTDIFTVPAGKTFVMLDCTVIITAANSATVGWIATVIESGASAAMIAAAGSTQDGNANAVGLFYPHGRNAVAGVTAFASCAAGNKVQYNVTTGAVATTLTGTIVATGFFI